MKTLRSIAFACLILAGATVISTRLHSGDTSTPVTSSVEKTSLPLPPTSSEAVVLVEVAWEELEVAPASGLVMLDGQPFSGASLRWHTNGVLGQRIEYRMGKKHGMHESWFANGRLAYRGNYASGRKHGAVETWWSNGTQRTASSYEHGVAQGSQYEWYQSGALFKEVHLVDGLESGLQRAWRENGALFANYEARDGRTFGMKRSKLCYTIQEEEITLADTIKGD